MHTSQSTENVFFGKFEIGVEANAVWPYISELSHSSWFILTQTINVWTDQRIPDPVSCRCPEPRLGLLETLPRWHTTRHFRNDLQTPLRNPFWNDTSRLSHKWHFYFKADINHTWGIEEPLPVFWPNNKTAEVKIIYALSNWWSGSCVIVKRTL